MTTKNLPADDHIVRYVSWAKLRKDEDDNVIGVLGEAFKMRPVDKSLSATWLEFFDGNRTEQITAAVHTIRNSDLDVRPKGGFAIGNVDAIKRECRKRGHKVRIVHEPADDNEAHVAVRRLPRDDMELLENLADDAWFEVVRNASVPLQIQPSS